MLHFFGLNSVTTKSILLFAKGLFATKHRVKYDNAGINYLIYTKKKGCVCIKYVCLDGLLLFKLHKYCTTVTCIFWIKLGSDHIR